MLRQLWSGVRALFRRRKEETELTEELRSWIETAAEEKVRSGMSRDAALRAARAELGSTEAVKEDVRDAGWEARLYSIAQDLRYAMRIFRKNPGFAAVAIISLSLGIGANTALFSLYDAVFLKPLPVKDAGDLVAFDWMSQRDQTLMYRSLDGRNRRDESGRMTSTSFPALFFERLHADHPALESVFAFAPIWQLNVNIDGQAEITNGVAVSGDYFAGLGVEAAAGRMIAASDDEANATPVAVLSYGYWQRRFASDAGVVGKVVHINNLAVTIVGVSGRGFNTPLDNQTADVTIPMSIEPQVLGDESEVRPTPALPVPWWTRIMARRKPGVSLQQVQTSVQPLFQQTAFDTWRMGPMRPGEEKLTIAQAPVLRAMDGSRGLTDARGDFRRPLAIVMSIVALVLLIACVNVANMLLARAEARQREIAVRLAIGAGRARVLRQLLTESVLLSIVSGALGMAFAYGLRDMLPALVPWAQAVELDVDLRVLLFTTGMALVTGLLFGLAPAWRAMNTGVSSSLKDNARSSVGRSSAITGRVLVVAQVALSVVLLIAAGLFLRTLRNLQHSDLGFNGDRLLLFRIDPRLSGYDAERIGLLYDRITERLHSIPGVESVTLSRHPLLAFSSRIHMVSIPGVGDRPMYLNAVGAGFLGTMGIPLLAGREITERDSATAPKVVVVNEAAAKLMFGADNPIGREMRLGVMRTETYQIVGLAKNAKYTNVRQAPPATAYTSIRQERLGQANFEVRTAADPRALVQAVRTAVHEVDGNVPIFDVKTQTEYADTSISQERLFAGLSSSFGGLALILAAIGLFGVMSYTVARRTTEIAIRMALGARPKGVLGMIVGETLVMVLAGIAIGVPCAFAAARLARTQLAEVLFGLKANDPMTFALAALGLLATGVLAAYIPARRAASVDPMVALRYE